MFTPIKMKKEAFPSQGKEPGKETFLTKENETLKFH